MADLDWTTTTLPEERREPEREHKTTVEGLQVEVTERGGYVHWRASGYLDDLEVRASGYFWDRDKLGEARSNAVRAARRLQAAGVRSERRYPVACCDATFASRSDADAHEAEHTGQGGTDAGEEAGS